jgi:hypothetical protein
MSRWLTTRRSQWLPGVAILVVAVCVAALVGGATGTRSWPIYLGLVLATLLGLGWLERLRLARPAPPPPPRARGKLKVVQGGKGAFDLERDKSTDDQKYVM